MAPTPTKRISSNSAVAEALNTLNSRIEKTETDFLGHLQKVEDRLDQIVDLTRTVAVLQQQSSQQTDQITEVRTQLRENATKFENSISRIHTRLDEIANHNRDKMELHSKELDIKINNVKGVSENTDKEFKTWLNRGWGAWTILILVFAAVQTFGFRWVDAIEKEKTAQTAAIRELGSFKDRTEVFIRQHEQDNAQQKLDLQRNSSAIRDLEDLIRRQNGK